jgi:hypothetical protein
MEENPAPKALSLKQIRAEAEKKVLKKHWKGLPETSPWLQNFWKLIAHG